MGYSLSLLQRRATNFEMGVDALRRGSLSQGRVQHDVLGRITHVGRRSVLSAGHGPAVARLDGDGEIGFSDFFLFAAPEDRATGMGVYQAIYAAGMFAGPAASGYLAQAAGLDSVFYLAAAVSLAGGFLGLLRTIPSRPG